MKPFFVVMLIGIVLTSGCGGPTSTVSNSAQQTPAGVPHKARKLSRTSINVGGNSLATALDVPMSQTMQDEVAVLGFGGHKLVVDFGKRDLVFDNSEPVKFPADAKDIKVEFVGGALTVKAGEATVLGPISSK
jgi:hypothetical protein